MIILKQPEELIVMREAGRIVARVHQAVREAVRPGVTTIALDKIANNVIVKSGAIPTFLGHPPSSKHPFPASITVSVNEELVHGIPGARVLQEGDFVSIDCAATYKGYVADAAFTMGIGKISPEAEQLLKVSEEALFAGIKAARVGNETKDISMAIMAHIENHGYGIVREYTGHGVGRDMWESPQVPNWWPRGKIARRWRSYPLKAGMTIALEPMVTLGKEETKTLGDHWTVVMKDGALCCHVEHTIAITEGEALILTLP